MDKVGSAPAAGEGLGPREDGRAHDLDALDEVDGHHPAERDIVVLMVDDGHAVEQGVLAPAAPGPTDAA